MAIHPQDVSETTTSVSVSYRLELVSSTFGRQIKLTNVRWTCGDQGDLTEEEAIAEAREIMANPDAYEWVPMKVGRTEPDT